MGIGRERIDFIVVGAQKAGTTALFDYLSEDPAIFLPPEKEVHFFDDESRDWSSGDYADYHRKFELEGAKICGEVTPIYMYWPRAMERIRDYNPGIRIVCLLRDPVERAWSHWRMETARGAERAPFRVAIRRGRQRLFEAEPWGSHRVYSYVERGFYAEQLARIFDLFPRGQVLVLQNEGLDGEPQETLQRFNAFVGAPAPGLRRQRRVHVGQAAGEMAAEDRRYLTDLFATDQARLAALLAETGA